ncbi:SDR family NAD(P)-dependent oxidoreductase [Mycolicibacterium sp. YH-1]|uniref:SDR family NAD(P)-dependent oxidoreductase n=1 Tax=Mycolicibacterium sp. YH-1 TaxID=2908837 RepID=UPI001F4C19E2|nr:SDR family NAD(P)-dependent oxidoreductase [Mycolicibacterium sp. YH-1]UNB53585.1 SDR family NAD(P)-dependent oxidoreductase [Mycolicibacterium sp. YH-1]
MNTTSVLTGVVDAVLDRSLIGYTKLGSGIRRLWWPADPPARALAGKRVVVTGATAGIGEAMATSFARLGATVHLLGRNPDKVRQSAGVVRREAPGSVVIDEICDIGDLAAVRAWTDDLSGRVDALAGLVHNAGAMPRERTETPQGHETQLACHVLGPHLITERLLPLLNAAKGSSVVFMSSGGMYSAPLRVDDIESTGGDYDGVRVYARTKRMQVVLAEAWAVDWRAPTSESRACTRAGSRHQVSPTRCRRSAPSPARCCETPRTAPTPRCGWWPPGRSPHRTTSGTTGRSVPPHSGGNASRIQPRSACSSARSRR